MFQKFYEFNVSSIFYKMRENFPSMRVSVRMYQIACVSRRMRETWKVCIKSVTREIYRNKNQLSYSGCTIGSLASKNGAVSGDS